jgi:hypothetical protein
VSDPRSPEDGPNWPERDLEENRAPEPGAGWSDDPDPFEPLPPSKPSVEPLEGEWSDSEPFDSEPPEPDPFAPPATPPQDDAWAFPPRRQPPPYEPAPTEPPFENEPAWTDTWSQPEQPAAEQAPEGERSADDQPAEAEPMVAEEPEPEPEAEAEEPETEPEPGAETAVEPEPESVPEPEVESEPISAQDSEPDAEPIPEPEAEPDPAEMAAAALAAQQAADQLAPTPPVDEPEPETEPEHELEADPELEFEPEPSDQVALEAAATTTAFGGPPDLGPPDLGPPEPWDPKRDGNRRSPTTAEQAVPWLIGIILALAGIVIVLLALIFSSPNGLVASGPTGSPQPSGSVQPGGGGVDPSTDPSGSGDPSPSAPEETPQPTAQEPAFGPLEMTYLGRPSAVAPVYLLLRDFSVATDPDVLAQAAQGVSSYANSPDGAVAATVIGGRAVALDRRGRTRALADNITTLTFGWDAETLYAVRITRDGGDDLAKILEIDFASGDTRQLTTIDYPRPVTGAEQPVSEAQFIDNGGLVRLYAVADGNLTLWVLGAPATYRIDPANGDVTEIARQPILWSPDGTHRVTVHEDGNNTALRLRDRGNNVVASIGVTGLVSHIRWAPTSNEIVFTLGSTGASGGVRQDLYVWDLEDRNDPLPLTSSGAAFGAEWRGVMSNWGP